MSHRANPAFWDGYHALPPHIQKLAKEKFDLLKTNSKHPSLQLKKVGKYWSVRIGLHHRALGIEIDEGIVWFWIGTHAEYDQLIA